MDQKISWLSVCGFIFAFILPLLGLILSIVALVQHKRNPMLTGRGFAVAGVIISGVFLVLGFLALIALLLYLHVAVY